MSNNRSMLNVCVCVCASFSCIDNKRTIEHCRKIILKATNKKNNNNNINKVVDTPYTVVDACLVACMCSSSSLVVVFFAFGLRDDKIYISSPWVHTLTSQTEIQCKSLNSPSIFIYSDDNIRKRTYINTNTHTHTHIPEMAKSGNKNRSQ